MKHTFTMIYHSEQQTHQVSRSRVAYLLRAARSRTRLGLQSHRPRYLSGPHRDLLLPSSTLFRHPRPTL